MIKLVILATLVALACAASRRYGHQPSTSQSVQDWEHQQQQDQVEESQHADPIYSYSYAIRDDKSGDWKSLHESRRGDQVRGQYRMMESDGTERIVDYNADERNGFNAVVRHQSEHRQHPVPILLAVHTVQPEVVRSSEQTHREATSNMQFIQHYAPQPWMISNHIRHN